DEPQKTKRATDLSAEDKDRINQMTSPQDIPRAERKRQYAALRRAILKNANPALTAKFSLCSDSDRFGMLKVFMCNQSVAAIDVEEKYESWVRDLRTDRYAPDATFWKAKMYKVLKEVVEDKSQGTEGTSSVLGRELFWVSYVDRQIDT
ncbi:unnamed protein product, partial [Symbiodinium necroappetens]